MIHKQKLRFLITAGPTREALDPARFLSNRSSGKMGYALAEAAKSYGKVTLISGPTFLTPPAGVKIIRVETADEMARAVFREFSSTDIVIQCAAVADYKPAHFSKNKIKKTGKPFLLKLVPTIDILAQLGKRKKRGQLLAGFAAETEHLKPNAIKKLKAKNLDFIVANRVGKKEIGFESDSNQATVFGRNGFEQKFGKMPKKELAKQLLKIFSAAAYYIT